MADLLMVRGIGGLPTYYPASPEIEKRISVNLVRLIDLIEAAGPAANICGVMPPNEESRPCVAFLGPGDCSLD